MALPITGALRGNQGNFFWIAAASFGIGCQFWPPSATQYFQYQKLPVLGKEVYSVIGLRTPS